VATNNRMALLEQLSKYVVEKDKDFLKEALTLLINALMDAEVTSIIGAEKYDFLRGKHAIHKSSHGSPKQKHKRRYFKASDRYNCKRG